MAETAKQRAEREANEAANEDTSSTEAAPSIEATQEPQESPSEPAASPAAGQAPEPELTLAEAREKAGRELAAAEALYYAGQATLAEVQAARSAWKATRRG